MRTLPASFLIFVLSLSAACGSKSTSPSKDDDESPSESITLYTATAAAGPWSAGQKISVTGHDAKSLVDPAPILMPDGSVLMYYLMNYSSSDPASSQPGNQWKFGVARATSNSTFTHLGVALTQTSSAVDPFPLMLPSGLIRLFFWRAAPGIISATSSDTTGLTFSALDAGTRSNGAGEPGVVKIGATYFMYAGGANFSSADATTFGNGQMTGIQSGHPIDAGGGTYLMAYVCELGSQSPSTNVTCIASSTNGTSWTQVARLGAGSVPGLVKDASGTLRVYAVTF